MDKKAVNKGLLGYHLGDIFDNATIQNDSRSIYQWNWLSGLKPESVRIFSGSFSKFMHPLTGPGYGWDLEEIIRFFDKTDGVIDSITVSDALDDNDDSLAVWIDDGEWENFKKYRTKWLAQNDLDSTHRYIDDFITMIKKIETENPGHTVKIIVCLNLMSASATECVDIVKYLRSNPIHNCTVAYVEMGNEMYFDFSEKMLGSYNFDDYWEYINGGYPDSLSNYVVGDSVWNNHNYIAKFKADPTFNCKVAIPARNLGAGFAFFTPEEVGLIDGASDWNDSLATHYTDVILVAGTATYVKKFEGVVIHPYYDDSNWKGIPDSTLEASYPCINLADADSTNDEWTYGLYDDRLEWAFDSITYNYRGLIRNGFIESYNEHNNHLKFYLSVAAGGKELLTTEYNYKYDGTDERIGIYSQAFMHGYLLQEWILKNIKLNFNTNFRANFFTFATLQNFAGASATCLITPANARERSFLGKDIAPYEGVADSLKREYHMKRTPYYALELLSEISKNNLKYVQANSKIFIASYNVQPTIFTNPTKTFLYIYFTNVRDTPQRIILNTSTSGGFYTGGAGILITDTATIYCIDAKKTYSTSGKGNNTLFDLNQCYDDSILFPIEILQIDTLQNIPSGSGDPLKSLVVPAYSFGFIKVPISPDNFRVSMEINTPEVIIYPNPASDFITIACLACAGENDLNMNINITNIAGEVCLSKPISNGERINTANLSVGVYQININFGNGTKQVKQFVKQ